MRFVYCEAGVSKQLDALRKEGGRAALVAGHVDSILRELTARCGAPGQAGRVTRNGEARLKECVKYDLVHSYRLIGLKRDDSLILTFVGTHDECDRWIKSHQRSRFSWKRMDRLTPFPLDSEEAPKCLGEEATAAVDEDADPFGRIDEVDLRRIFHGLAHE